MLVSLSLIHEIKRVIPRLAFTYQFLIKIWKVQGKYLISYIFRSL